MNCKINRELLLISCSQKENNFIKNDSLISEKNKNINLINPNS